MTALAALLPLTGYRLLYRPGLTCPCCDRRAWHVGRASAECAGCGLAMSLAPAEPEEPAHG